jgi:hypothetical protein
MKKTLGQKPRDTVPFKKVLRDFLRSSLKCTDRPYLFNLPPVFLLLLLSIYYVRVNEVGNNVFLNC